MWIGTVCRIQRAIGFEVRAGMLSDWAYVQKRNVVAQYDARVVKCAVCAETRDEMTRDLR